MGGGSSGGNFYGGSSNVKELEDIAKKELQKIPQVRRKVFVSFIHTDKQMVDFLRGQAKNEGSELDFIDMSLKVPFDSDNADYIKRGIRARIDQSSVTMVAVSEATHKSDWVNWEVRESIKMGKGVIVVKIKKDRPVRMPTAVEENRDKIKVINWNHKEIMDAIDEAAERR